MSILVAANTGYGDDCDIKRKDNRDPLFSEIFELVGSDLQLMMIYKKIEIAAETGDWPLMNELYGEFKNAYASQN